MDWTIGLGTIISDPPCLDALAKDVHGAELEGDLAHRQNSVTFCRFKAFRISSGQMLL